LTGSASAWDDFRAALDGVEINDDDPFNAYASAVSGRSRPAGSSGVNGHVTVDPARKMVTLPRGWMAMVPG
jgi:hypothetical protein